MNYSPKISVIVPIYNAGVHLIKCLDSLVNQTLEEIEIILVLDCPTDGSDKICEEYASKDNRIIIVRNNKNLHIGLSRNEGLKVASGEYIGFSDHDDFRELTMYEELYDEALSANADVVLSAFASIKGDFRDWVLYPDENEKVREILPLLIGNDNEDIAWHFFIRNGSLWNKIYRRSLLVDNNIFFEDNRKMSLEDLFFQIQYFVFAKKVACVNKVFYYHVEEIDNTASGYTYYSYPLIISYLKNLHDFLNAKNIFLKYKKRFYETVVFFVILSVLNELYKKPLWKINPKFVFEIKKQLFVRLAFNSIRIEDTTFQLNSFSKRLMAKLLFCFFRY